MAFSSTQADMEKRFDLSYERTTADKFITEINRCAAKHTLPEHRRTHPTRFVRPIALGGMIG